jgi:hypothetical protein
LTTTKAFVFGIRADAQQEALTHLLLSPRQDFATIVVIPTVIVLTTAQQELCLNVTPPLKNV